MSGEPNHFDLSGRGIHVTYLTADLSGKPHVAYHDRYRNETFAGDQVSVVEDANGLQLIVSVTIVHTVDTGSTSFSFIVPRINLPGEASVPVRTLGITVLHRLSPIEPLNVGQRDSYSVVTLHGAATRLMTPLNPA
jgi:hypothetical protein